MGDDGHGGQALLVDELGQIVEVAGHGVAAVRRPLAVTVPAQIGSDDVPLLPERFRRPVPVPAMIPPPVKEEEGRLVRVAPVHVVEAAALGEEAVRGRPPARPLDDAPLDRRREGNFG